LVNSQDRYWWIDISMVKSQYAANTDY